MNAPYVVTEDIRTIFRFEDYRIRDIVAKYVSQSILLHCKEFITENTTMLYENELTKWVTENSPEDSVIKTITYSKNVHSPFLLRVTRVFSESFDENTTYQAPMQGHPSLKTQLVNFGLFNGHTIVDDIILNGRDCKDIIEIGKMQDVFFKEIIACVTTDAGKKQLDKYNIAVKSLYHFDKVLDVVYERDFVPGIPFSGRTVIVGNNEYRYAPRIFPWGNPTKWANIPPKNAIKFSKRCIMTAIDFWEEVYPSIRFFEVPAVLYDPSVESTKVRFVDYLHKCYKAL